MNLKILIAAALAGTALLWATPDSAKNMIPKVETELLLQVGDAHFVVAASGNRLG